MEPTSTTKTFNPPESKLHFLDYWRIIRIRKTVILAVFLLVAITTTLITFILPETFSSTVRLKVEKDTPDLPVWGDTSRQYWGQPHDPFWVQDQFETIQSKVILYQVITNLGLTRKWAEKLKVPSGELSITETFSILKGSIDVRQYRSTSLIEIRAFSEKPKEAADIANEIANVYADYRRSLRQGMALRGISKLKEELHKQESLVRNLQTNVAQLKADLGISDYDAGYYNSGSGGTPEPEILRSLERQRIEAQAEYKRWHALYVHLTNLSKIELKKAIATAQPDQLLTALLAEQNTTEQNFAEKVETFKPDHPEVLQLTRKLAQMNKQVDDRLEGILKGMAARVTSEEAHVRELTTEAGNYKTNEIRTAILRRPYWDLKRELENQSIVRDRLSFRIIQAEVEIAIPNTSIVEILDAAEASRRAVRPNKILNIGLGVVIGLMVGIGLAFFIEYLDTSVKTIDDVERALQAPVLGVIPQNVGSLLEEGPDSPHAEAYRVLHTNILFSQKDQKLNTLTIVSAGAGEGKSTTVFNLAATFARSGQRVLLVDSDLRRPSLHKFMKVSNSIGLTNYLLRQNTLEEVIQTTQLPTFDFLPSGKLPSSSMGLLSSSQMKDLIRELKRRYDWVFFDSPPVMGVSDASILASEVDMVLQVIQYRRYPQPMTIRAKQMVEKVGGNHLGIVLNNISMSSDESYYYYSGYYYDYYSKNEEEPKSEPSGKKLAATQEKVEIKTKY
jgi:capsular exopolysaccharide synthesis family protein